MAARDSSQRVSLFSTLQNHKPFSYMLGSSGVDCTHRTLAAQFSAQGTATTGLPIQLPCPCHPIDTTSNMAFRLVLSAWETLLMNGACSYLGWHDLTKLLLSNRTLHCMQAPQWQQLEGALHFLQAFAYRKHMLADLLGHWLDKLVMILPIFTPWSSTPLQIWGRIVRTLNKVNREGGTSEKSLRKTFQSHLRPEVHLRWRFLLQLPLQLNEYLSELVGLPSGFHYRREARHFCQVTEKLTPLWMIMPMVDHVALTTIELLSMI